MTRLILANLSFFFLIKNSVGVTPGEEGIFFFSFSETSALALKYSCLDENSRGS